MVLTSFLKVITQSEWSIQTPVEIIILKGRPGSPDCPLRILIYKSANDHKKIRFV